MPLDIRTLCDSRGLKYRWLAEQLRVSPQQLTHNAAGRRKAPAGFWEQAARVLGVPVELIRPAPEQEPEPVR